MAEFVERRLVVVVGGGELPAPGQHDLVALDVVAGAVAADVTDARGAVVEHPLGLLVGLPERLGQSARTLGQTVGLRGVEDGVLADVGDGEFLEEVDALALGVAARTAALVGDGDPAPVLEREGARAAFALSDLSASILDPT